MHVQPDNTKEPELRQELFTAADTLKSDAATFRKSLADQQSAHGKPQTTNGEVTKTVDHLAPLAESSRDLLQQADLLYKLAARLSAACETAAKTSGANGKQISREITRARKSADEARQRAVEQLKQVHYFWRQAHWLVERFPDAELQDVEGLVKLVDRKEIAANDWSLTPGRYVGVAPEEEDENFDFKEALRDVHAELKELNTEAAKLAATIDRNFEELGI